MTKLALFDMDGTLSDDRQRKHFYDTGDYVSYFSYDAQMADPVYEAGCALYKEMILDGWTCGILTARLEEFNRPATEDWLKKNEFVVDGGIFMRPAEDKLLRPARFKTNKLAEILMSGKHDNVVLIDNDPLVITRVTEELGAEFCFFADWDMNPTTRSIASIPVHAL